MKKLLLFALLSNSHPTKPFFVLEPWNAGIWFYSYLQHSYVDDEITSIKEKLEKKTLTPEKKEHLEDKQEKLKSDRRHYARIKKVTKTIFQVECALTATVTATVFTLYFIGAAGSLYYISRTYDHPR